MSADPTEYTPDDTDLLDDREPPASPEDEELYTPEEAFPIVSAAVGQVEVTAGELNTEATLIPWLSWDDAAVLLHRLREARKLLQKVENGLEIHVAKARIAEGIKDPVEIPGVGVVTHRRTANRKDWDHDGLAKEVIGRWIEDHGGEIPDGFETRDLLMKHAAISYWRVAGLKEIGVEVDDFCTKIPGRLTVDIQAGEN